MTTTYTWSASASGSWGTNGTWTVSPSAPGDESYPGASPSTDTDVVNIGSGAKVATFTITQNETASIYGLTLDGYNSVKQAVLTLQSGEPLTIGAGGLNFLTGFAGGDLINGTGNIIVNGTISGTAGQFNASSGTLDVSGTGSTASGSSVNAIINTLSATTLEFNLGNVALGSNVTLSNANQTLEIASGIVTVSTGSAEVVSGGTLALAGGTFADSGGVTVSSGSITGYGSVSGAITMSGGTLAQSVGALTLTSLTGSGTVIGAPSASGAITASGGTLDFQGNIAASSGQT